MSFTTWRTSCGTWTSARDVISPRTSTNPVLHAVSHATRAFGSSARCASRMASETWSHNLSGCPSVTDSEVKRELCRGIWGLSGDPPAMRRAEQVTRRADLALWGLSEAVGCDGLGPVVVGATFLGATQAQVHRVEQLVERDPQVS